MGKFRMNRLVKSLNSLVSQHKELLLMVLSVIVAFYVYKSMFKSNTRRERMTTKRKIIYFHMDGCGHCKKFTPEWERFVQGTNIPNSKINASSNSPLIKKLGISGYPTVVVVEGERLVETFNDERTAENLNKFASKHIN